MIQLFSAAFQIPHLLQYLNYRTKGITTSPIPFDFITGLSTVLFCYLVQPLAAAPARNMTIISWPIAVTMMVFGWKHVYLVPELDSVVMIFVSICALAESRQLVEEESLSNNKID